MPKPADSNPSIADARALAMRLRKRGVVILTFAGDSFDCDSFAAASFGMTRRDCDVMRRVVDQIAKRIEAGDIEVK